MKKRRWLLILVILLVLVFVMSAGILGGAFLALFGLLGADHVEKEEVFEFVCEQEDELLKAMEKNDFSEFDDQGLIQKVKVGENVVDFSCGGAGIGSGTFYVGFYYTEEEDRVAVWWAPTSAGAVVPEEEGFEWKEANGDNRYYTEKICENFYYYEAGF